MTLDEIKTEMARKPDAQVLLEWISARVEDPAGAVRSDIGDAIDAYDDATADA